jgi:SseB protein N-terminal domain
MTEPENELERELQLAAGQPTMPPSLREALERADVLVPVPGPVPESPRMLKVGADEELTLPVWEEAGMRFVPVFTSERELARGFEAPTAYLRIPVRVLADALRDGPALVRMPDRPPEPLTTPVRTPATAPRPRTPASRLPRARRSVRPSAALRRARPRRGGAWP